MQQSYKRTGPRARLLQQLDAEGVQGSCSFIRIQQLPYPTRLPYHHTTRVVVSLQRRGGDPIPSFVQRSRLTPRTTELAGQRSTNRAMSSSSSSSSSSNSNIKLTSGKREREVKAFFERPVVLAVCVLLGMYLLMCIPPVNAFVHAHAQASNQRPSAGTRVYLLFPAHILSTLKKKTVVLSDESFLKSLMSLCPTSPYLTFTRVCCPNDYFLIRTFFSFSFST